MADVMSTVETALKGDDEATAEQRQSASGFLCRPMNTIDLAKKDGDLPKFVEELAKFIARREKIAVSAERERCGKICDDFAKSHQTTRKGEGAAICAVRIAAIDTE